MKTEVRGFQGGLRPLLEIYSDVNRWQGAGCLVEGWGTLVTPSNNKELPGRLDCWLILLINIF